LASPAPIRAPKAAPLGRADWIRAAFARLAQDGIDAVRVEVLARDLHVSKGSFYWHFRDRDELAGAMLEQWDENESAWVETAADERSAAARWAELVKHLTDDAHSRPEAALRDWARRDPRVAERAREIERKRRGYIAEVLEDVGFTVRAAEAWSEMGLLVCLGWVDRATRDPEFRSAPKRGLGDFLSELVLAASARSGGGR
jgi:AcrR family transcriptional regulator